MGAKSKQKTVRCKEVIAIPLDIGMINTRKGVWCNPSFQIIIPEGTEVTVIADWKESKTVELDFTDFKLRFNIRNSIFER